MTDTSTARLSPYCHAWAKRMSGWDSSHRIDWIESVEAFANRRSAVSYANWLYREGAFEGVEDYVMGLQADVRLPLPGAVTPTRQRASA